MSSELVWIIVGLLLLAAELFFSGFILVFFGMAALVTGVAVWIGLPTAGGVPYLVFSAVAVGLLVFLRRRFHGWFTGASIVEMDDDILGHEATVESGFDAKDPHRGKVSYRGAGWEARCEQGPLATGSWVRIVARHGLTLQVVPISENTEESR